MKRGDDGLPPPLGPAAKAPARRRAWRWSYRLGLLTACTRAITPTRCLEASSSLLMISARRRKHHHSKNTTVCVDCLPRSERDTVYLSAALLLAIVLLSLFLLIRRLYFGKDSKRGSAQSADYAFLPASDSEREGSRERGQSDSTNSEMSYNSSIASHDIQYYHEYIE